MKITVKDPVCRTEVNSDTTADADADIGKSKPL